jgi:GNAT superfamily N-acetyltransferase
MTSIAKVTELDVVALDTLRTESVVEGYKFVARLCDEWRSGMNRFCAPGEGLFVAQNLTGIVGVCGLNRDPYLDDPSIGRVRHLYVSPSYRRQGIGRALVRIVMDAAGNHFRTLRLKTTPVAGSFYQALGFRCVSSGNEPVYVFELGVE